MPWGDSLVAGFQAGVDAKDKKKRRQLDEAEQAMRRELTQKQLDTEILKMRAGFDHDTGERSLDRTFQAGQQSSAQTFQGTQADKDRGWRTGERVGSEGFQGTQSELDRAARSMALDKQLAQQKAVSDAELAFKGSTLDWEKNPQNPKSLLDMAHAGYLERGGGPPEPPDGASALSNGTKGQLVPPPQAAIDMLKKNPNMAAQFDAKYGPGASTRYLGR